MRLECRFPSSPPIQRDSLVCALEGYHESIRSDEFCSSLDINIRPRRLAVLSLNESAKVFGSDVDSFIAFEQSGGLLLRTTLAYNFVSRSSIFCDINFWHLWDIIVFSGWLLLDVELFSRQYNRGVSSYLALVRTTDTIKSSSSWLSSCGVDKFADVDVGYSIFEDICSTFSRFIFDNRWLCGHNFEWANSRSVSRQRAPFSIHASNLTRMVNNRCPPSIIIASILEINALCVSASSGLPSGFLVTDYYHLRTLLIDRFNLIIHSSELESLFSHITCHLDLNHL